MKFLTFDIEDYHHLLDIPGLVEQYDPQRSIVDDTTNQILDMLKRYKIIGVFFVLGEVAAAYPKLMRRIAADGHILGTHSHKHLLHKDMSDEDFKTDLLASIHAIELASGQPVRVYRAPGFSLQDKYFHRFSTLREFGILYDFSLFEGAASHGGVKIDLSKGVKDFTTTHGTVTSFPFLRSRFFGLLLPVLGGGYFRLSPKWLIKLVLKGDEYAMTYFHPRDFCPNQPRLNGLNLFRYFKAYVGLSRALEKLEMIICANNWNGGNYLKGELDAREDN